MAARDNVHSRLVAWLKILLPLAALGMLSTLFLFSHSIDPTKAIRYSKVDVKKLAREPQVTAPDYAGVTQDGTAVTVSAAVAKPMTKAETPDPARPGASASGIRARFERKDGATTTVEAPQGQLDPNRQEIKLGGGVRIDTSDGYRIRARALTGALDRTHLQSAGAVTATGPLGRIEAGGMVISAEAPPAPAKSAADVGAAPGPYVLVFNGGVKLIYTPPGKGN
ncbi:hypothetical protein U879_16330 [Defluviimonas sp. 20V17]|uniref:Lipopolysaccharide export system protein LptC n=1 Tax=Allgaiera indica TaxID=765699 RepID=A0AAN4UQZ5_9RHOB|nr:LPS export ABC transporter periplasmic protein LptC [Allgaiera indica]KDB02591.1 hypothetical protein U879_16330 [Defluviimonas sp. 20V17]GHE01697.1 hypothetical protein GCM10008024_18240 [Allgaiera indica]SDW95544.1 lipopolysaccharide export system protein LptC [Allgaiera indica]